MRTNNIKEERNSNEKKGKNKRPMSRAGKVLLAGEAAVLLLLIVPGLYCGLTVQNYSLKDERFPEGLRIVLVTDLHSCKYGKDEIQLIRAVREQAPDLLLLGGDIFDDKMPNTNTEAFLAGIAGEYPCYYVTGNHECWVSASEHREQMRILEKYGVKCLHGDADVISIRGQQLRIRGIDDPDIVLVREAYGEEYSSFPAQLSELKKTEPDGIYTILLAHRPGYYKEYSESDADLILCGHMHGGQWRIPGVINGLFTPAQGLFPDYAGGLYTETGTAMIVGRGLARETTPLPRLYNPPELVVIDICQ